MYEKNTEEHISSQPLLVFVILVMMALRQMVMDQYIPSLPAIAKDFQSNEASIQLTLSLFMLGLSISHVFYGPLSDKVGRKSPLMFGVGISILGSLCCYLAPSVFVLILGRFIQGVGIGCCGSVGRSLIRDLFTDRVLSKFGSYIGVVSAFIMVASPILGGYFQECFGWRFNFLFLFVFGTAIWILAWCTLPETNKSLNPDATKIKVMLDNYCFLLKSKVFLGYSLCTCFAYAGLITYLTITPFLFQDVMGLSPIAFGQLTLFIAGAICVSGIINSQLVMKKGVPYMVCLGVLFMIVSAFSMLCMSLLGIETVLSIMIPVSLFSMGIGFIFINSFAGAFHPFPHMAGTVGALYACMQDLSSALASGIIALGKWYGQYSLSVILLTLGVSSLIAWYYLIIGNSNNS